MIASIAFAYLAFSRNKKADDSSEGKQNGIILTEIGYIKGGIDDIKMEQREQRKVNTEVYWCIHVRYFRTGRLDGL